MPRLSQTEIKAKADEWAAICQKIEKSSAARDAELAPLTKKFENAMKPITEHWDPKIAKLEAKRDELEAEVIGWLNEQKKPLTLEGEKAVAELAKGFGPRVIDPKKFYDLVKAKGTEFWECLKVEIMKAEKFLGKTEVDRISTKPPKMTASLTLK